MSAVRCAVSASPAARVMVAALRKGNLVVMPLGAQKPGVA
jgi:hypothetical protein